jgi:uncharacterized SAM-binding protein YcdF (DUF218 family)
VLFWLAKDNVCFDNGSLAFFKMTEIKTLLSFLLLSPMILPLMAAVGLAFQKQTNILRFVKLCLYLFMVLSLPATENTLSGYWESSKPLQLQQTQEFLPQAIVVIGGGTETSAFEYEGAITVSPRTLIRLRYAAKLAKATHLPLLASGGVQAESRGVSEAALMANVLESEFAVPAVWQERESLNTHENARFSKRLLQQHGIDRIILVTQAYHMPRAELEFRKAGFQVLAAPTNFMHKTNNGFFWKSFMPSVYALENAFLLAHESVGMLWYGLHE